MVSQTEIDRLKAKLRDQKMKAEIAQVGRERDREAQRLKKEISDLKHFKLKRFGRVVTNVSRKGGKVTMELGRKAVKFLDKLELEDPFDDRPRRRMPKRKVMKKRIIPKKRMIKRKVKGGRR